MSINAAGIIFSNLNTNTVSEMTVDRTVAAIPFGCRYRLIDFCISNLISANISNINIVANYNYRSLVDHIGSGKDFDLARRKGGINFVSPFQTSHNANSKLYSYRMQALKNMKEYISEFKEDIVILMDADHVMNINLLPIIDQHIKSDANITLVTRPTEATYSENHPRIMVNSVAGKVSAVITDKVYNEKYPEVAVNVFIMNTAFLRKVIAEAEESGLDSLTDYIIKTYKYNNYRTFCYRRYVAPVTSFRNYYRCSMELVKNEKAHESLFGRKEAPIYTKVHNSAPTIYSAEAKVENSLIADDCVIEGTVINSVLSRNVHVGKGAVVKNSVLLFGTSVGKGASINCVVTDKDVQITDGVVLSGHENLPIYIEKKRKI